MKNKTAENKTIISPIAIDLGAQNTGVFFAHYEAGDKLENIEKQGKVYRLEKDGYTLLMANRTAARHQRRGYDRRQMAKRLFKLIWEKHLNLPWDEDVQQTISFLLNRRGFSFLTPEYDRKLLRDFPQEAFDELPEKLQKDFGTPAQIADKLSDWTKESDAKESDAKEKFKKAYGAIDREPSRIKRREVIFARAKKLRKYCEQRMDSNEGNREIKEEGKGVNLSKLSRWVLDEWKDKGLKGMDINQPDGNNIDVTGYLNKQSPESARVILDSIPDYSKEEEKLKSSIWNFKSESFESFEVEEEKSKKIFKSDSDSWIKIKTHIHHLAYAIYKHYNELQTGGRYRSKYFEEIREVLECQSHKHKYLDRFCLRLENKGFSGLDKASLGNLIGHISNLELKPLRKYFNDGKHKERDYWCEKRFAYIFGRWISSEWRVGEKDKEKQKSYHEKLQPKWSKRHENNKEWKKHAASRADHTDCRIEDAREGVVSFFLDTDPNLTIPPYQDNNNRRPPKCQSLVINVAYLKRYPSWQQWLQKIRGVEGINEYVGDYESRMCAITSGKGRKYFDDAGSRSMDDLDARILQFILDRVKRTDVLNLNEIYSHAKKLKQNRRDGKETKNDEENLVSAISGSLLPNELKTKPNFSEKQPLFPERSFLHLVCKYYKLRQRARDGRLFIFPEYRRSKSEDDIRGYVNTGRFADKNSLLTYCNHKPRQKRYQILNDIARLLQISPDDLVDKLVKQTRYDPNNASDKEIDKIAKWLENSTEKSLQANCERAAKEQKDRRGRLKEDIRGIYSRLYSYRKRGESLSPPSQGEKEILKNSRVTDASRLYSFCERAKTIHVAIIEKINSDRAERLRQERDPVASVYFLAQVENILFKERSGNAGTCAVCSLDNAERTAIQEASESNESHARAQPLPAIETRMFDGAIMRMARILGNAIAKDDRWEKIWSELKEGAKVRIPIITESNKFEFEPSKEELVKGQRPRSKPRKGKATKRDDEKKANEIIASNIGNKDERIKAASKGICPYCDNSLGSDGDKDHILPRSGSWKTLNDEANLIYVCRNCNRNEKGNESYFLSHLGARYKENIFPCCVDNDEITAWVVDEIWDEEREDFKFGRYRSFINLSEDEKIAFRHALFLADKPNLRNAVIAAIDNRNRAFVNGTQRYVAEMIARAIHKKALDEGIEGSVSFDYFSFPAYGSDSDSIKGLREKYEKVYEESNEYPELRVCKKEIGKQQKYHSHLIDAQMAFILAAYYHKKEGSLRVDIDDNFPLYPYDNEEKTINENMYRHTRPDYDHVKEDPPLKREKAAKDSFRHRVLFDSKPIALHFLKLIEIRVNDDKPLFIKGFMDLVALKGFLKEDNYREQLVGNYGYRYRQGESDRIEKYGELIEDDDVINLYKIGQDEFDFGYKKEKGRYPKIIVEDQVICNKRLTILLHQIDHDKVGRFLVKNFNTLISPKDWSKENTNAYDRLYSLSYRTKRRKLFNASKKHELQAPNETGRLKECKTGGFLNPQLFRAWTDISKRWEEYHRKDGTLQQSDDLLRCFLEAYFKNNHDRLKHNRVRREYSLPVSSQGQGALLIARSGWNRKIIYQVQSTKQSANSVNTYEKRRIDGKVVDILTPYFRSSKIVFLKKISELEENLLEPTGELIGEQDWYPLNVPENLRGIVASIENQYQSKNDSNYRVAFKEEISINSLIELMHGGYHIDEMVVGKKEEKGKITEEAKTFFQGASIVLAREKLERESEAIEKEWKEISNSGSEDDKKLIKKRKKFVAKWLEVLDSIQDDGRTLLYKRGVSLKIEASDNL